MKLFVRNQSNTAWEAHKYADFILANMRNQVLIDSIINGPPKACTCKGCGAPLKFNLNNCEYCGGLI